MSEANNVVTLLQPESFLGDPLTGMLRNGARALLAPGGQGRGGRSAKHIDLRTASGLGRVVRHGHLPERAVMTGIGPVSVRQPVTAVLPQRMPSASASRPRSCRPTRGAPGAWRC